MSILYVGYKKFLTNRFVTNFWPIHAKLFSDLKPTAPVTTRYCFSLEF
jgi:hypothetical protein